MRTTNLRTEWRSMLKAAGHLAVAVLFAIVMFAQPAWSQSNAVDGAVSGYITDQTGGAIPFATVTLTNQDTNVAATAVSKDDGFYRFPLVKIGTYTVSVKVPGYEEYIRRGVTVAVGSDVSIPAKMTIGSEAVSVDVNADASMLDTATPAVGGIVTQQEMDDLPIISRNVYNLFFFVPGAKGIPSDNFATPGYSFGGVLRSSWVVDGIDDTDRTTTSPIRLVINVPGTIKQIQVLSNGYQAEFGKTSGGQTSIISRSGSNAFHGSAIYSYRPKEFAALPWHGTSKANLQWYMAGANLGGPIIRDRLFFFANYEHNPYVTPSTTSILPANQAALGLTSADVQGLNTGQNYNSPSLRLDYTVTKRHSGFMRYAHFTNNSPFTGAGGLNANSATTHNHDNMDSGTIQLASTLSASLLNELRFGINRRETNGGAQFTPGPNDVLTTISGVATIGNTPSQSNTIQALNEIVDNVSLQHGKHLFKAGIDYQYTRYRSQVSSPRTFTFGGLAPSGPRGTVSALNQYLYTIAGTIDPSTNKPYTYTNLNLGLGDPTSSRNMHLFNGFIQDQYRFSRTVTASMGLRYEKQLFPESSPDSLFLPARRQVHSRNLSLAPRFNLTWNATSKTIVSAASGLFFDVPNLSFFTTVATTDGNSYHTYTIPGGAVGAPTYPNIPDTSAGAAPPPPPNLYTFDPTFKSMYAVHANMRIQQVITKDLLLSVSYMFQGTRSGPFVYDTNLTPTGKYLDGGSAIFTITPRPNANFGRIYQYTSGGTTSYNGLDVSIEKRLSHGLVLMANYSYSHALGDSDQNGYVVSDPSNVHRDYGNLSTDVRHYFIARGIYTTKFKSRYFRWASGIGLSTMTLITSGYPLDARTTSDPNGDGTLNDRLAYVDRNSFRGPNYYRVDARASKSFTFERRYKLEAFIEGSNLMNHTNAACSVIGCNSAVQGNIASQQFGQIISASQQRVAQVGGRFTF